LAWPDRISSGVEPLDLIQISQLNFEAADEQRFPCLKLARDAFKQGGTSMAILNAANEVAVASFLNEEIKFTDIPKLIDNTLQNISSNLASNLDIILEDDRRARQFASQQSKIFGQRVTH
jgi:1-deoxy-D-xylulose-5-phosphate reductoisomerase